MGERDPFGRLPDENPLAGLGSLSDGSEPSAQTAQPVASGSSSASFRATPADDVPPRPREPRVVSSMSGPAAQLDPARVARAVGGFVRIVRLVVVVAVLVAIAGVVAVIGLSSGGTHSSVSGTHAVPAPAGAVPVVPSPRPAAPAAVQPVDPQAPAPVGLQPRSLLAQRNFVRALRRLRLSGLGRLRSLRIAAERIDVQLLTKGGRLRSVQLRFDGTLSNFGTSGPGFGGLPTIPFSTVSSAAPARLARGAAARMKRPLSQVDYVVRVNAGPTAAWTVVMRGGGQFIGDARGHITRRIG